jgi:acyl carrier protein
VPILPEAACSEIKGMTMLDRVDNHAMARVGAVVADVMAKHGGAGPIAADADLGRLGLTSIDMVELMLGIEAEFDITIPPAEITLQSFRSVAAVTALVTRLI